MRSRKNFAKSQEHVYKQVGQGSRQRFKLVPVAISGQSSSAHSASTSEASHSAPPIIVGPMPAEDGPGSVDIQSYEGEEWGAFEMPRRKKGKRQSDYMRFWLNNKRTLYMRHILSMKAGPQSTRGGAAQPIQCPRCGIGRPNWRCVDCMDKHPICVLCCRNRHKSDIFHRVEKWNGRFYQRGALWQVGVKIYTGHNGSPCPKSIAALSEVEQHIGGGPNISAEILGNVALELGLTQNEVIVHISDALDHPIGNMNNIQRDILSSAARRSGRSIPDLLRYLKERVSQTAEEEADLLQAESDKTAAEAEVLMEEHVPEEEILGVPLEEDIGGEDDWEDEDQRPAKGDVPRFLPRAPPSDGAGNQFLTVVHNNGFHALPVVWCACNDHFEDRDLQLLSMHLYPASYDRFKTVFTFACLDDHRYEYLECKSSHYQYHNKLRRLTCPEHPDSSPDRYKELGRVARQWRNLKYRKWFWMLTDLNGRRGEMALFCAACPQDGINLPPGWREECQAKPGLFMRSYVADGNMKAVHLKQKDVGLDVALTHGEAFMTNEDRYQIHLAKALESKLDPSCHRHRAQLNGEVPHNSADCTGLGGHSCARHGCFAPSSLVNFQKGERQMNMDWSLCEAVATTHVGDLPQILHIYDINCQYFKHLKERIQSNDSLKLPEHLEFLYAIGQFHVHGHKNECLYRFATSYVPGAGIIDGEVLETLWAVLNTVSAATRTASLAHRTEILDDHMNDSNWKKMIHIVKSVIGRYRRALENIADARQAFTQLDEAAPRDSVDIWQATIQEAETARSNNPAAMDVMQSQISTGESLKEITAAIMREDGFEINVAPDNGNTTDWLLEGFRIEDEQIRIRQQVRTAGRGPTPDQVQDIERKRLRLANRIRDFHITACRLIGADKVGPVIGIADQFNADGYVTDDTRRPEDRNMASNTSEIENTILVFPSSITGNRSAILVELCERECRLRRAKANDTLGHVRETLSGLSYQYINKVRQSKTTKEHLRAYAGIKLLSKEVSFFQQVYNRSSRALGKLDPEMQRRYPQLRRSDCTISTAIADVNARGQSQARLPWFWAAQDGWEGEEAAAQNSMLNNDRLLEFYRVNWMRARAQKCRWEEELPRTEKEMIWTTLYFMHQRDVWYGRLLATREAQGNSPGQEAYCEQKISQWEEFARVADFQFRRANVDFPQTWQPILTPS